MDARKLGKEIKKKRRLAALTQEQLAEKTDLSVTYIGMLERGERIPGLETLIKIADALNATTDELLYGNTQKSYLQRLEKYAEKIAGMNPAERKKLYAVIDALLDM